MSRKSSKADNGVDKIQDKNVISEETVNGRQNLTKLMQSKQLILHDLNAKLKTAESEYEEVFKKVYKQRSDSMTFIKNVFSENETETKKIKELYDDQILRISNDISQKMANFPVYDARLWQSKLSKLLDFIHLIGATNDVRTIAEAVDNAASLIMEILEELNRVTEKANEVVNRINMLIDICNDILNQSKAFQMKKNVLRSVLNVLN